MSPSNGALSATRSVGSTGLARRGTRSSGALSASAVGITKLVVMLIQVPLAYAAPLLPRALLHTFEEEDLPKGAEDPNLWAYLGTAMVLVLLGGAFAGLTIALMGQDEIYLQVIATSGEGSEKKNAQRVLKLLNKGKHWVLVTLLLSNVITNETLPIVLDRSLGGGWPAVLGSTVLIVIFGEIAPQSVCVRYGLPIGAWMSPFVLGLMWFLSPVAWPTAKLLDWLLGEDHGTVYKKAGLKTLVTLHKTLGTAPGERLNEDEVTIISAVLDLKDKPVGDIMTPMQDVFTMSADTVLDEKMMDTILSQGYSRIPIYAPENPRNFIGMLLVKILITYDPEDAMRVRDFSLATLPETAPNTSCLDIVNFFQEGKSHMVLCSDFPGQDRGALGVVTLEDVIEELIGEEIIDESDVFVDVHRAIRRVAPAPRTRYNKAVASAVNQEDETDQDTEGEDASERQRLLPKRENSGGPKSSLAEAREATFLMRRRSSAGSTNKAAKPVPVRSNTTDLRQHLKHLGPSNVASRPKATKYTSVKIKPGVGTIPEGGVPGKAAGDNASEVSGKHRNSIGNGVVAGPEAEVGPGGSEASDGAIAVATGYGTMDKVRTNDTADAHANEEEDEPSSLPPPQAMTAAEASAFANHHTSTTSSPKAEEASKARSAEEHEESQKPQEREESEQAKDSEQSEQPEQSEQSEQPEQPEKLVFNGSNGRPRTERTNSSHSTLGEMENRQPSKVRRAARSGSITENVIDVNGMKKMVLETTSSSDTEEAAQKDQQDQLDGANDAEDGQKGEEKEAKKNKKKKKRGGKKFRNKDGKSNGSGESSPLLKQDD